MIANRAIADIRFDALRNALYHTARRRICERWAQVMNFLVIIFGAATIGNFLGAIGIPSLTGVDHAVLTCSGVVFAGGASMVFDFAGRAAIHRQLQGDYYRLLSEIVRAGATGEGNAADFDAQLVAIYANEPPVMRAIDAKAYNDALDAFGDAMGYSPKDRLIVPWLHSVFGQFCTFEGHEYHRYSEDGA